MCLAKAYISSSVPDSQNELLMESVARVDIQGDRVQLVSLFGETKELPAQVRSISFAESIVVLESSQ